MGRRLKRIYYWWRRRSHLPVFLIGALVVLMLFFNEETSFTTNMRYEKEISELKKEIKENEDSAAYFRKKRDGILSGGEDLEYVAREQYHLQRPTEDVYLIKENKEE